jgi:ADP-ribosylglycohydrolase
MKESLLFKKAYGCLIGGAVGDALGGPIEGMHYRFIREWHNGRVEDLIRYDTRPDDFFQVGPESGAYALGIERGTYTDDTRLQHLITQAIIAKQGRISADDLGRTWMEKMKVETFWFSVSNGYYRIGIGQTPVREAGAGNIPDNSSAMCIGPIGVINAGDPEQAALDAYDIASLSHDGYSREAASIVAAAVAEAMDPSATVESVVEACVAFLPNKETSRMREPLLRAIELADRVADTEELTAVFYERLNVPWVRRISYGGVSDERHSPSVDPLESVPCAVAMFYKTHGSYKDAVVAAANYGRDGDTIACMTGYIAGAFCGVDAIPADWVAASLKANPVPDQEALALGLAEALVAEKRRSQVRVALLSKLEGM